jgi:hypothetical protein
MGQDKTKIANKSLGACTIHQNEQIKEDEMDRARSMHGK